ncbi:MAG: hypothetical protein M3347_11390, partial [Armatimonadota bacterium]|nr:hypothetical protein [Armatimonadota bacterium]
MVDAMLNGARRQHFMLWMAALLGVLCPMVRAQQPVSLMELGKDAMGWTFGNGPEFPGATGGLAVDPTAKRDGRDSLKLSGDFTKGGKYVQAGRDIPDVDIRELSLWVRNPDSEQLTLRIIDATGQCHQIKLKTEQSSDWQRIVFPLQQFFARRGQADAVTSVAKYEYWGGAKDGQWHGPARAIYILLGEMENAKVRNLWMQDVTITPRPTEAPAAEIATVVRLDDIEEGEHDWQTYNVNAGKVSLTPVKDDPAPGQYSLKYSADLTKGSGGQYVGISKNLQELNLKDITAIRLKVKSENTTRIGVRLKDGTGQTHQKKGIPIVADGQWHELVLKPAEIAGGEHWGGANDGQWHGQPAGLEILLNAESDDKTKQPVLYLTDIRAEAVQTAVVQAAAFKSDFEGTQQL